MPGAGEEVVVTFLDNDTDRPLSYLIDQRGNHRGALRGTGFELRTDAYGACAPSRACT